MAAHYIKAMQTLQAAGPYFLAGLSFGGRVAFEMAQQLQEQGEQVGMLGLVDTWGPGYFAYPPGTSPFRRQLYALLDRLVNHAINFWARNPKEKASYVLGVVNNIRNGTTWKSNDRIPLAMRRVQTANNQARRAYVPQAYNGRVTLFRARKQPIGVPFEPTLGWGRLAVGGLEIHDIPGYHGECCREPHVAGLAEILRHCLRKYQTEISPPHATAQQHGSLFTEGSLY